MEALYWFYLVVGLSLVSLAIVPRLISHLPLDFPIIYVGVGYLAYLAIDTMPAPDPLAFRELAVHLTEAAVIVALTAVGLKIDRPFGIRRWSVPFRLVLLCMVLTIALMAALGWWLAALVPAAAILLGAAMAPTDPVLASTLQVGPPLSEGNDEVRFSLTAEGGINDCLAFPFTYLAVQAAAGFQAGWWQEWLGIEVLYKILAGLVGGYVIATVLAWLLFRALKDDRLPAPQASFVALGMTILSYGAVELVQGYGFIAVITTALTFRSHESGHRFHKQLHDFAEQVEHILVVLVLVLFGGALAYGLLDALTLAGVLVAVLFLLVVRPMTAYVSLLGVDELDTRQKWLVSFFGIRGVASFFYLAYGLYSADFAQERELWAIVGFIVLLSVVVHGVLATPALKAFNR